MAIVKLAEAGFAVTSQEMKKENYLEVKLRKQMREFFKEEIVQEWFEKKEAVR